MLTRIQGNRNQHAFPLRMCNRQLLWKAGKQVLKKLSELPHGPAVLLPGMHPREMKTIHPLKNMCMNIGSNIIHNRQKVETTQHPELKNG